MISLKKDLRRNEGFTLVELMIVISIIAILAVVLVPRVGSMKESVREQGVTSNVNSVRAMLELEINNKDTSVTTERDRLVTLFNEEYDEGNQIINPFTNGVEIGTWDSSVENDDYSVVIEDNNDDIDEAASENRFTTNEDDDRIGKVVVVVCTDGYMVFGMDSEGIPMDYYTVE